MKRVKDIERQKGKISKKNRIIGFQWGVPIQFIIKPTKLKVWKYEITNQKQRSRLWVSLLSNQTNDTSSKKIFQRIKDCTLLNGERGITADLKFFDRFDSALMTV